MRYGTQIILSCDLLTSLFRSLAPLQQDEFECIDAIRNLKQKAKIVQDVENRSIDEPISSGDNGAANNQLADSRDGKSPVNSLGIPSGLASLQKAIETRYEQEELEAHTQLLEAIDRLSPRNPVTTSTATSSASMTLLEAMRSKSVDEMNGSLVGSDAFAVGDISSSAYNHFPTTPNSAAADLAFRANKCCNELDVSLVGAPRPLQLSTSTISNFDMHPHLDKRRKF
jgi:hypothetical protein